MVFHYFCCQIIARRGTGWYGATFRPTSPWSSRGWWFGIPVSVFLVILIVCLVFLFNAFAVNLAFKQWQEHGRNIGKNISNLTTTFTKLAERSLQYNYIVTIIVLFLFNFSRLSANIIRVCISQQIRVNNLTLTSQIVAASCLLACSINKYLKGMLSLYLFVVIVSTCTLRS